jgi:TolB-like protein
MNVRSIFLPFFASALCSQAAISVAINQSNSPKDEGVGSFVFEALEVQLAGKGDYELVDRKRLQDMLQEQSLSAADMTNDQASKVGKLVGAKYYVFGETKQAGEKTAISCRVVQVESGVFKPVLLVAEKNEDPVKASENLANQVAAAIAKLEGRATEGEQTPAPKKLDLPEESKRPVFAFRIPEVSVTPQGRTADPAAEKSLEAFLQANGCKLVQLSRPSQSAPPAQVVVTATASGAAHLEGKDHEELLNEARAKGVTVLVLGVATSERTTQIGNFSTARARVELSAIRTGDSRVLATASAYGVGSDLSAFVAEKKAIESATGKIQTEFSQKTISAYRE